MNNINDKKSDSLNISKINDIPQENNDNGILDDIFTISKTNLCLIPLIKKNCGKELKNIFDISKENMSFQSLVLIITKKINLIFEIKKIISNKIEIIHIINNYLIKYDIYLFKNYIDLYLQFCFTKNENHNILDDKNSLNIITNFQEIFIWFINCGLLNKDITDYVFQKIAKMQLEKTLTIDSFNIYVPLLEILYGKNNLNPQYDIIAKNYIYLFDKDTSIIKTNISPLNQIKIDKGLCIILWFYLYDFCIISEISKVTICQILTEDLQKIDIILNYNYDIDIKYNSREILKEKKGHKFKIKNNSWIQLKINFTKNKIRLFLHQNIENNYEKKYDIKEYLINYEDKTSNDNNKLINNKVDKLKCINFNISYINFFMGYEGLVGTILFCNNDNDDSFEKMILNNISGLQNNKIIDFIEKINLKNIYFIIGPSLYCEEDNKFIYSENNINAELSLETNENCLNVNSVLKINNYTNNIFHLGGCNNLLPLFEILYQFSCELNNNKEINTKKNENVICSTLINLFKLLEIIFINKKKNCIEAYNISNHFFESLQLLLENIDEKYFNYDINYKNKNEKNKENYILSSLINLGKYFFEIKNKKILESNEHHGFFENILFYPSIIMKFNSILQNKIFSFFDIIKKENIIFKNTDYKTYFISFDKISNLLILLSQKYNDEYIPSNLFNIIKIIFEDPNTTDNERESLFLLNNNHLISDKVFINIMEIFIIYFDINTNINLINKKLAKNNNQTIDREQTIKMRNNSIKYFLYSSHYFIENLLNILLSKNLYIKKLIINCLRILTNKYYTLLEEYFSFVNECNKNYKNKRINKKDFYYFIKENIIVNENNQKILKEIEKDKDKNVSTKKKKQRNSSFEYLKYKNKLEEIDNINALQKRKSLDIQFGKNQKKKIIINLTKKKKKRKNSVYNIARAYTIINKDKKRTISSEKKNLSKIDFNINNNIINKENAHNKDDKDNKEISSNIMPIIKSKSSLTLYSDFINEESDLSLISLTLNNKKIKNENIPLFEGKDDINLETNKANIKSIVEGNNKKKKHKKRRRISRILKKNNLNEIKEKDIQSNKNIKKTFNNDVNINCDISMILYDWLVSIKTDIKDNSFNNKSETIEIIQQIINYIVKFLSYTTELEVIYRTLFIILGQKGQDKNQEEKNEYNQHYSILLSNFSKSYYFRQLLEEIILDSFLGFNDDKKVIDRYNFSQSNPKVKTKSNKSELFKKIYNLSKELLIDIYFYKNNQSRNFIIYEIYNIILKKYNGLQKKYNESIYKLFIFLKNFYAEISNKYHVLLNNNDENNINNNGNSNSINNNEKKIDIKNKITYKNYIHFFTLFFEFSFIFKNYSKYLLKKNYKSELNFSLTFPSFLKEGMIFELNSNVNNIEKWNIYNEYKSIIMDINKIYNLKNIFIELNIPITELDKKDDVFQIDIENIQKLVNELIFKNESKDKFKENIELLFSYYNNGGYLNNFPLINILSLYKCVLLNYEPNNLDNNNLIQLLNEIQSYVIFIILASCNIKKEEKISEENLNYDDIQEIIYQNLLFIMRNIIYKFAKNIENKEDKKIHNDEINTNLIINDENEKEEDSNGSFDENEEEYETNFITILNNIFSLLGNIYIIGKDNQNNSNSFLGWRKGKKNNDINCTGVNKLIEHYIKIFGSFFNIDNLTFFSNHNNHDSNYLIKQQKKNLYNFLVKNINDPKFKDKSNTELFHYKIFKSICLGRENEIKKKMKLLLKANQEDKKINIKKAINNRYKKLLIKINYLQLSNKNKDKLIEESRNEIFKIKNYRKIKKYLYSYNNSYSNLESFYNRDKKYILIYRISNYISHDNTRKLIEPILDFEYYLPNFRKFNSIDGKLFKENIVNKLYKVNLRIIDKERLIIMPEQDNKKYYIYNDICFIKTTHHIRGKIFHKTEKEINAKKGSYCLYFAMDKNITKEYLLENCADYDSLNGTCFGSTFRNNINKKDEDVYIKIKFSEINYIFLRKYCFRSNSVEFFLNNHKTFYFKFRSQNDRDTFMEKLIYILNHYSLNKKLFKTIKSIDENNKQIVLGYYKDIDNNKDFKSISDIRDLWKNSKISSLEYLMWINIYGNRSFRDIAQYPVFPWILNDYNLSNVENIINFKAIRNFNLPMGMMAFDEKSNARKEGYIEGYNLMVNDISDEINIKKPNNSIEENEEDETKNSTIVKTSSDEMIKDSDEDNSSNKSKNNNIEKENKLKIPDYKYDLEKLYYNLNIEYERIPYLFGTHYSNSMYVSHFLLRLFPFCFNMIEIQGEGFDCPERLFFNLKNTFYSSTHEKCDLRELIPEFFTLPEMFINLNNFNFGKTEDKYYFSNKSKNSKIEEENSNNIINTSSNNDSDNQKNAQIEDVALPPWTKQNPYYFIQIMREIFEGGIELNRQNKKYLDINPWIDLIFGYYQRGIKAQNKGNLFLPAMYDGVIDFRIKEEALLKNRSDNEFLIRFFEIGVNPTKVFEKICKEKKKEINYQITSLKNNNEFLTLNKKDSIKLKTKKVFYLKCNHSINKKLILIDNNFNGQYLFIHRNKESTNNINDNVENNAKYIIKENQEIKDFKLSEIKRKNYGYKLIIKYIFKESLLIITGYYDGSIYLISTNKKVINKRSGYNINTELNSKENNILQTFGGKLITSLEISNDEKYMICGNEKGVIIIFSINYSLFIENKKYIELLKVIKSHNNHKINSISINNNLFLFADCSYDGYINLYTFPKIKLINSIYINDTQMKKNEIDFVFLSSQPLPVIVLYSNKKCLFKVYSINGHQINCDNNDLSLLKETEMSLYITDCMISPVIFTNNKFNDYLAYIFKYKFILIRKFPNMNCYLKINCSENNYFFSKVFFSKSLKYLFAYDEKGNNIYITDNNIDGRQNSIDNNSSKNSIK